MPVADLTRFWFLVVYAFTFLVFIGGIARFQPRREAVADQRGPLPTPGGLITFLVPPLIMLLRVSQLEADWLPVRVAGVVLSLYAVVLLPWATWTLGRLYIPGAGIFKDHQLVTSGPFRFLHHPIYSAILALWLGAALGTLNWLLLLLWPGFVIGVLKPAQAEEELLRQKFGGDYERYARDTSGLVLGLW
jgi:protein-S-isoprenylcysteine O-methyltransferase Ste14